MSGLHVKFENSDVDLAFGHIPVTAGPVVYLSGYSGQGRQVAEATTNLITNPSFETNTTSWSTFQSTIATTAARAWIGSQSLRVSRSTGTAYSTSYSHGLSGATAGRAFSVQGRVFAEGDAVGKTMRLSLRETGGAQGAQESNFNFTLAAGWNYINGSRTIVENDRTSFLVIFFRPSGAVAGEYFDLDAAQLEEKAYITPYADGTLNGHSWTGTAHASTSTRPAATLYYANPLNLGDGSVSLYWNPVTNQDGPTCYFFDTGEFAAYFNSTDNKIYFTDGVNTITTPILTFSADVWQLLEFTWQPNLKIFQNSIEIASGVNISSPSSVGGDMWIGSDSSGSNQANGLIDELLVLPIQVVPVVAEPTPSPNYKLDCFTPNGWRILKPIETTNYVLNPSAETTGNFAALGTATITRSTDFQKYGLYSYRIQSAGSGQGLSLTLSTLTNSVHWMTARIRKTISPPEILFSIGPASHRAMLLEKIDDHWDLYGVMFSATSCNGQTSARISQYGVGAGDFYVDGIQIEPLSDWTTYVDGTQDGCGWNGAEHASTSTRSSQSPDGGTPKDLFTEYKFFTQRVIGAGAATQELTVDSYALLPGGELNSIKVQSRQFTLIGKFICDTEQELHDNQQDLHKLLKRLRTVKLQFNGARVQKEITVVYQGGLEGDLASFYKTFEASGESDWVENFKFIEKANIQFLAPDPFWYEVGESAALLDTNDSDTFRVVAGRLRSTGQWDNLGPPGAGGTYDRVEAIAEDDVYIYFGGNFTNFDGIANADYIVRYHKEDGIYSALSTGMDLTVRSLVVGPDGTLYAGGQFTTSGGVATNGIASWNGSAWSALGSGAVGNVLALDFGPDGLLYAGGDFNSMGGVGGTSKIAKWDGSNWFALGSGMNSDVRSIAFGLNGILYAGGFFTTAGGTAANRIASWNGSAWSALGSGLNNNVEAVAVNKTTGTLYVSGSFTTAGGNSANYIASWNGSAWSALGSGLNANSYSLMVSEDGILYAGGFFTTAGGITLADRVARWNGYAWTHLDIDFPGSPIIYAILTGRHTDPVVKQKYNLYLGFDTIGTGSFAGLVTVENEGNVPAFPKIIFERSVTGLPATIQTVQNETTGKILLADYSLLVGERLTVDLTPTKKSVVSNFFGEVPSAILANSDFGTWRLEPDSQNISCFVNTGGALYGDSAVTHLLWRDKFDSYD